MKLYQVLTDISPKELLNRYQTYFLPTEMVVSEPRLAVPAEGRIYETDLYLVRGVPLTYQELRSTPEWETQPGTSCQNQIYLYEYFTDWGDDGHVHYSLRGWIYVDKLRLEEEKQKEITRAARLYPPDLSISHLLERIVYP